MHEPHPIGETAGAELRRRAAGGVLVLGARGALILLVGVGANIVLARLLGPRDFGVVALGAVLVTFGGYLADGGLGAALLRRNDPPIRAELAAVNGAQLAVTLAIALAVALGAAYFGRDGLVAAVMVASLPITVLKTPAIIMLERALDYRVIATVDVAEALTFYAWSVTTVALGLGVWGMATGMIVRAVVGTGLMAVLAPDGLLRPRLNWSRVKPLLRFGGKVQTVTVVTLLREQGMNVAVAAIAGVATLGVWNLAWRVLQVPYMVFLTVSRVAYPAMSRLLAVGEAPRALIERGAAALAVTTSLILVALVGLAPALPALVGSAWEDVPETLLWSALALVCGAPITVVSVAYLYAVDAAGAVVFATTAQTVVWLAVALPLLPDAGAPAIGIGWLAGTIVSGAFFVRAARWRAGANILGSVGLPQALAIVGGGLGWWITLVTGETVLSGVLGAVAGELVFVGGLALLRRSLLAETYALAARALRERMATSRLATQ